MLAGFHQKRFERILTQSITHNSNPSQQQESKQQINNSIQDTNEGAKILLQDDLELQQPLEYQEIADPMTNDIKELFSFSTYRKHLINHTVLLNEHKIVQSDLTQLEADVTGVKENN